jgi:hypothetical protein
MQAYCGQAWDNPTYEEAKCRVDWPLWNEAIKELSSIQAKGVFEQLKADKWIKKPIPTKLVLHIKRDTKGNITKYKARLVVRAFTRCKDVIVKRYMRQPST